MAVHMTPTELARETGLTRSQVISKCMELGVPVSQGRVDRTLFEAVLRRQAVAAGQLPVTERGAVGSGS